MTTAAHLTLRGATTGLPGGSLGIELVWDIAASVAERRNLDLGSGANTITPPTGCTLAIFIPPTTNTQTITLKGVSGDTGIALSKTTPAVIPLLSVASFVLTTGGAISDCEIIYL